MSNGFIEKQLLPLNRDNLPIQGISIDTPAGGKAFPKFGGLREAGVKVSKYTTGMPYGVDPIEWQAQHQTVGNALLHGVGRFAGTTATKFLEGLGYFGGLLGTLVTQDINTSLDNAWVNLFRGLEEDIKNAMPIHHTRRYLDGNILDQMGTLSFWMDDVIDGAAFMTSALIGAKGVGTLLKGAGAYGRLGRLFARTTRAAKTGKVGMVRNAAISKWVSEADLLTMSLYNSMTEAGFEAKDVMDQLIEQGLSREEAAEAARNTYWSNVVALMPSNYIVNSLVFKTLRGSKGRLKSIFKDGKLSTAEISELTPRKMFGVFAKDAGKAIISEGPYEENIQLAIQNYEMAKAVGDEGGYGRLVELASGMLDNFTTDEGQKNIVLGSIIGLLPGGIGGIRQAREEQKSLGRLRSMMDLTLNEVQATFGKDYYERKFKVDNKGAPIGKGEIVIENGKPKFDAVKLANLFIKKITTNTNIVETLKAVRNGDELMFDFLREARIASLAYNFLGEPDGLQHLENQLDNLAEQEIKELKDAGELISDEDIRKLKQQYKQRAKEFQIFYDNIENLYGGTFNFGEDTHALNFREKVKQEEFSEAVNQSFWIKAREDTRRKISELEASDLREMPEIGDQIASLEIKLDEIDKVITESKERYKNLVSFKKMKERFALEQEVLADPKKAVKELRKKLGKEEGKEVPEYITVVDKEGEEYEYQGRNPKGEYIFKQGKQKLELGSKQLINRGFKLKEAPNVALEDYLETLIETEVAGVEPITVEEIKGIKEEIEFEEELIKEAIANKSEEVKREVLGEPAVKKEEPTEEEIKRQASTRVLKRKYGDTKQAKAKVADLFDEAITKIGVIYRGDVGTLFVDKNQVIFKDFTTGKEYIISGITNERAIEDLGITPLKHTVFNISLMPDGITYNIQGRRYNNLLDRPIDAIKRNKEGEAIAVTLYNEFGNPITFTNPTLVEEVEYSILLIEEARDAILNMYIKEEGADFVVVKDPASKYDKEYHVYNRGDAWVVAQPRLFGRKAVVNEAIRRRVLEAFFKDMNDAIDNTIAATAAEFTKEIEEDRKTSKEIGNEIRTTLKYIRPATPREIIDAPGTSEVTAPAKDKGTKAKAKPEPGTKAEREAASKLDEQGIVDETAKDIAEGEVRAKKLAKQLEDISKGVEPLSEDEIPEIEKEGLDAPERGLKQTYSAIAYKGEENEVFNNFISNPNNTLKGYKVKFEIDYEYEDETWKWAPGGLVLSKKDILKELKTVTKDEAGVDNFESFVDNLPIKAILVDNTGKELPFTGLYYHVSGFKNIAPTEEILTLFKTDETAAQKAYLEHTRNEMRKTREHRRFIIEELLKGYDVVITKAWKSKGIPDSGNPNTNITKALGIKGKDAVIGIAKGYDTIYRGNGQIIKGRGGRGGVFLEIDKTANGEVFNARLNISRISKQHAAIIFEALRQAYTSKTGFSTQYMGKEVENLTVGEVLNYLTLVGDITDQNNKETNPTHKAYLVSKQLFVTDKKILHFGDQTLNLFRPEKEEIDAFIEHLQAHKNYAVLIDNKQVGTGLDKPMPKSFKIGSFKATKGMSYNEFIIDNNIVVTDLKVNPESGSAFNYPVVMFSAEDFALDVTEVPTKVEEKPKEIPTEVKEEPIIEKEEPKEVIAETIQIKKAVDLLALPVGTIIYTKMVSRGRTGEEYEFRDELAVVIMHNGRRTLKSTATDSDAITQMRNYDMKALDDDTMISFIADFRAFFVYADLPGKPGKPTTIDDVINVGPKPFARLVKLAKKRYKKFNEKEELAWINKRFARGKVEVQEQLLRVAGRAGNALAFGMFKEDSIILAHAAEVGIAYHEAFHRVSLGYLSVQQRDLIYDEARKRYNLQDKNNRDVEEVLAEKFRDYILSEEKVEIKGSKLKQFFKDLWDFIKTFFYGQFVGRTYISDLDIDHLFRSIERSRWFTSVHWGRISKANKAWLRGKKYYMEVKGRELKYLHNSQHIKTVVKNLIYYALPETLNIENITQIQFKPVISILQEKTDKANDAYLTYLEKGKVEEAKESKHLAGLYQEIIDNFDIFHELVIDNLASLNIRRKPKADPEDEDDIRGGNFERYGKTEFETSSKDNALASIKILIATLPSSEEVDPYTKMYQFVDLDDTWDTLLFDLHDGITIDEIERRLKLKAVDNIAYTVLLNKFKKSNEEDIFDTLRTQFAVTVNKARHNFINHVFTKRQGKPVFIISSADLTKAANAYVDDWGQSFVLSELSKDKAGIKNVLQQFRLLHRGVKTEYEKTGGIKDIDVFKEETIKLLNTISIFADEKSLNKALTNVEATTEDEALYKFITDARGYKRPGQKGTSIQHLFGDKSSLGRLAKGLPIISRRGVELQMQELYRNEAFVRQFAEDYVETKEGQRSTMVLGPGGNPHWLFAPNSYLSDWVHLLRRDDRYLNLIQSILFNRNSYLLKQLEDPAIREKFKLNTFASFSQQNVGDRGRHQLELFKIEDFLNKFHLMLNNRIPLPVIADKKTLYLFEGLKRIPFKYAYNPKTKALTFSEEVTDVFIGYAEDEHDRIERTKDDVDQALEVENTKDLVKNLHYITDKKGKPKYKKGDEYLGNGTRFQHFVEFNTKPFNRSTLRSEIKKVLNARIEDQLEELIKLGIISGVKNKQGLYSNLQNKLLDPDMVSKAAKEFNGNEALAIKNLIADFTINTIMSTIEFEKLITMDPAFYIDTDNKIKRYIAAIAPGDNLRVLFDPDHELYNKETYNTLTLNTQLIRNEKLFNTLVTKHTIQYQRQGYTEASAKRLAEKRLQGYLSVDQTDAQVYITPAMHRSLSLRLGEWSPEKQKAFKLLNLKRDLTLEEQQKVDKLYMQPLKFVYFGPKFQNGLGIPVYNKMSLATLHRKLVKGTQLEVLLDRMEDENNPVDMVKFDSAVKAGEQDKTDFYSDDTHNIINNEGLANVAIYEENFQFLRRQQITDPKRSIRALLATQIRKIAVSNLAKDGTYLDGLNGEELAEEAKNMMNELSDKGKERLFRILDVDSKTMKFKDPRKFLQVLQDAARKAQMPDALVDALTVDENGIPYEFDALPDRKWIIQQLVSMVNKRTVDITVPGNALIQMSNFGLRQVKLDDSLELFNAEGKCEVKVSVALFRNVIPNYDNITQAEREQFLKENFEAIGYRIPTQGLNSTVPMVIVGFLPETSADTIILPADFTALTGSDFDIDDLYVVRHNYEKGPNNTVVKTKYLTPKNSTTDQRIVAYMEEALADDILEIDKIYSREIDKLRQDINATTEELLELREIILPTRERAEVEYYDEDLRNELVNLKALETIKVKKVTDMRDVRKIFKAAREHDITELKKRWLAKLNREEFLKRPVHKQNTKLAIENRLIDTYISVLTSLDHLIERTTPLGVFTKDLKKISNNIHEWEGKKREFKSLESASSVYQQEVKQVHSGGLYGIGPFALHNVHHVLSQIAGLKLDFNIGTGHVDEEGRVDLSQTLGLDKIPISGWLSALVDANVDISADPYIFNLNVNRETYDVTGLLIRAGHGSDTFHFLAQPALKELVEEAAKKRGRIRPRSRRSAVDIVTARYKNELKRMRALERTAGKLLKTEEEYKEETKDVFDVAQLKDDIKISTTKNSNFYYRQLKVLQKYSDLRGKARFLSDSIHAVQVDNKNFGNNLVELKVFNNRIEKVLIDNKVINFNELLTKTFVGHMYDNSAKLIHILFADKSITASQHFAGLHNTILEKINQKYTIDKTLVNTVSDAIYSHIIGKFFSTTMGVDSKKLKGLIFDKKNLIAKLYNIKHGKQFKELQENPLIKILDPVFSFVKDSPDFLRVFNTVDTRSKWAKDDIIRGWQELLTHESEEIRNLGEDLIIYSFYNSGFRRALYSFYSFIPPKFLINLGLNDFVRQMREGLNSEEGADFLTGAEDEIFRTLWYNNSLVYDVHYESTANHRFFKVKEGEKRLPYPSILTIQDGKLNVGTNKSGEYIFRPYIKMDIQGETYLYKNIGYLHTKDDIVSPVYKVVPKKGYLSHGVLFTTYALEDQAVFKDNKISTIPDNQESKIVGVYGHKKGDPSVVHYDYRDFVHVPAERQHVDAYEGEKETIEKIVEKATNFVQMRPENVEKILMGTKTTTIRSQDQASKIGIPVGNSASVEFGGKMFKVFNKGLLTVEEAGGKEAMLKSEGIANVTDFEYQQTKDWITGEGKLYVFDIKSVEEEADIMYTWPEGFGEKEKPKGELYRVELGEAATYGVLVENGIITKTAPLGKKFLGQPIENLINWAKTKKGTVTKTEELLPSEDPFVSTEDILKEGIAVHFATDITAEELKALKDKYAHCF